MKTTFLKYATLSVAMAAAVTFTACQEDDKLKGEENKTTETEQPADSTATTPVDTTPATPTDSAVLNLGTVSFASDSVWTVGSQEWSDAVQATGCQKIGYKGGASPDFLAACRPNPNGYKGDLFSWKAITDYKDQLCPEGWRVPSKEDFAALDITLRGSGEGTSTYTDAVVRDKYLNLWGGSFGGYCDEYGTRGGGGEDAFYWSQSEHSAALGFYLCLLSYGTVHPQFYANKGNGFTLRCVR